MGVFSINIASQDSAQACVGQRTPKSQREKTTKNNLLLRIITTPEMTKNKTEMYKLLKLRTSFDIT